MAVVSFGSLAMNLGEGPSWNPVRSELTVVDIFGQAIHRLSAQDGGWAQGESITTSSHVGAALPLVDGTLISVESEGIFRRDGHLCEFVCAVPAGGLSRRPNDAKLGPDGLLYVGVMDYDATEGKGSLWSVNSLGESELLLDGLTIPNGMDWWGEQFWLVNGPEPVVTAYKRTPRGLVASHDLPTRGTPDGLTIDQEGNLWVALWGEGRVDCYGRDGELLHEVNIPASLSTSVAFCGPYLSTLAITSARYGLSPAELRSSPSAGDVFFAKPGVRGRHPHTQWKR